VTEVTPYSFCVNPHCPACGVNAMDELERYMTEDKFNCLSRRVESLETRQKDMEDLISSVAVLAQRMGTVEGSVSEIRGNVRTLMYKPAKRWDSVVEKTLLVVVGAVVAWVLSQIGI